MRTEDYIAKIEGGEVRANSIEFREEGEAKFFVGYGIVYDTSTDIGGFTEEIVRGAADDALGDDVRGLFNHEADMVLGRTKSGTMTLISDEKGISYRIAYNPNDPDHVRVREKVMRGDISQSSFAFKVKEDEWSVRNGKDHRKVTKIKRLYDMSLVTYPAYNNTTVAMRSMNSAKPDNKKDLAEMDKDIMRLEMVVK